MKTTSPCHPKRGATLVEAVIAVGVLAVAIPLVFGAIAEAGKTGGNAQAETRSTWIVPVCLDEIRASRDGKPRFFTTTKPGETFPSAGDVWALAFSEDGNPIGKISKSDYDKGLRNLDGKPVRYIASMAASQVPAKPGVAPMLRLTVSLEYPSSARAAKRAKLDFHSRIP
jgi:hypothetical protein